MSRKASTRQRRDPNSGAPALMEVIMEQYHIDADGEIINHADWLADNGFASDEEAEEYRMLL